MEDFIIILIVSVLIGFIFWLGYMWGKMNGYEQGFLACQRAYDEILTVLRKNQ